MASQACLLLQKQLKGTQKPANLSPFNKSVSSTTSCVFSLIEFDFVFAGFVFFFQIFVSILLMGSLLVWLMRRIYSNGVLRLSDLLILSSTFFVLKSPFDPLDLWAFHRDFRYNLCSGFDDPCGFELWMAILVYAEIRIDLLGATLDYLYPSYLFTRVA